MDFSKVTPELEADRQKAYVWGQIYAVLESVLPADFTPRLFDDVSTDPGRWFGPTIARFQKRHPPEWAEKRIAELLSAVDLVDMDKHLTIVEQGIWSIGFYHERDRNPDVAQRIEEKLKVAEAAPERGRPPVGSAKEVDWSRVDWSRRNSEISRYLGVSPQAVAQRRKKEEGKKYGNYNTISP
jgi:hypothetical protein